MIGYLKTDGDLTLKSEDILKLDNGANDTDIEEAAEIGVDSEGQNRTAILLLDFQNEFVKKGGKLYDNVAEVIEENGVLQNASKLVAFAR